MEGRIASTLLATALWLAVSILPATAQSFPVRADPYVNDYADLLAPDQEQEIAAKLADLRKNRDIDMTVLTIESRATYGQDVTNEVFATNLFNTWGIGGRARNDGVLILVSLGDREMRIEVGSGYGNTKDAALKKIIDRIITDQFRMNTYDTGLINGVDHTIREIAGVWPDQYDANVITRWWTDLRVWAGGFAFVIFAPFGWIIYQAYHAAQRRRPRRCPNDSSWMPRVLDEYEHKHLTSGQIKEEELASKEYDVWVCRECDNVTIKGFRRWFSKQKLCKTCGYNTLESYGSAVTHTPTRHSAGERRTDFQCNHCNERYSVFKILPMISDNSSSGSGFSGGGGGGGSSSGGGASGSW